MTPVLGSCQQILVVLYMDNLQMWQNADCFVWILCFCSQSLHRRISSPLPLLSSLLVLWLLLCGVQPRSSAELQLRAPLWWHLCAHADGGLSSGSPHDPEHPGYMGSRGFASPFSGGRNEGSACVPFLLQPNPSSRQELLGCTFCYTLPLLTAAETPWDMVYSLRGNSRASPEPSCWQISLLWDTSQTFSVFWGALVCPWD